MVTAKRTDITLTVYSPTDEDPNTVDLSDIAELITTGGWIGGWNIDKQVDVEGEELRKGLLSIGNDGTFFDED